MLPVASSGLVLICNILDETYICLLNAYLLACVYEIHLIFLTSHISQQYQSLSQEMMGQICDLETVEPHETPIKVCVMFYNIEICYRGCGEKKQVFLQSFNIPKCMVVGLFILERAIYFVNLM